MDYYFFHIPNKDTYPPFKNGLYLEEYYLQHSRVELKRKYIPLLWTNFQIDSSFRQHRAIMQSQFDEWIQQNPSDNGYYTIVQYDDGPQLKLPDNTIVFGACTGNIPIPLIYEDTKHTLMNYPKKSFVEKNILCSFVGCFTSTIRNQMFQHLKDNEHFKIIESSGWTPNVAKVNQDKFIETTIDSKFALAPRGYGRSSFRFFECFLLGTIPVYIWDDIEWLPFKHIIDYNRLCISVNIADIGQIEERILAVDEQKYNDMWSYYEEIKHLFTLEGMSREINNIVNHL